MIFINREFSFSFDSNLKSPSASYLQDKIHFKIPLNDSNYFKESIFPLLDIVFNKISKNPNFNTFPEVYFDAFIKTTFNYTSEFISKLKREIVSLTPSQVELFLEYNRYNLVFAKNANPLFDILRIKKGILTKKIISSDFHSVCKETYNGFIRVLQDKTAKFITVKIDGKEKNLLVKSFSGIGKNNLREGTYTFALDPTNFRIYAFINNPANKNKNFKNNLKRVANNKTIINNFIDFEAAKNIFFDPLSPNYDKIIAKDIISQVFEIKNLLKKYSLSKQKPKILSFKRSVEKMLKDKETREVIKKRFRK